MKLHFIATIIAAIALAGCTTTTTTAPDGTVTETRTPDAATVGAIAGAVTEVAKTRNIHAEK